MAKTSFPDPARGMFVQNQTDPKIYDIASNLGSNLPFSYFRVTLPRAEFLIKQGAVYVAESHINGSKILYTGLKSTSIASTFTGDMYDRNTNKKSLIVFRYIPDRNGYEVLLFDGYYPRSISKVINQIAGL